MGVPQFTTPTFTLTFTDEELDLTQATAVFVTFCRNLQKLTKTGADLEVLPKQIGVFLTQDETAESPVGDVEIQVNWTTADGQRFASDIAHCTVTRQLLNEVV